MRIVGVALVTTACLPVEGARTFADGGTPGATSGEGGGSIGVTTPGDGDGGGGDDTGTGGCSEADLVATLRATNDDLGQPGDIYAGQSLELLAAVTNPCDVAVTLRGSYNCLVPFVDLQDAVGTNLGSFDVEGCAPTPRQWELPPGGTVAEQQTVGPIYTTSVQVTVVATFTHGAIATDEVQVFTAGG